MGKLEGDRAAHRPDFRPPSGPPGDTQAAAEPAGAFGGPALLVLRLTPPGGSDTCLRAESPAVNRLTGPLTLWLMGLRVTDHKEKLGSCRAVTLSTSSCGEEAATLTAAVGVEEWEVGEGAGSEGKRSGLGFASFQLWLLQSLFKMSYVYTARPVWLSG